MPVVLLYKHDLLEVVLRIWYNQLEINEESDKHE